MPIKRRVLWVDLKTDLRHGVSGTSMASAPTAADQATLPITSAEGAADAVEEDFSDPFNHGGSLEEWGVPPVPRSEAYSGRGGLRRRAGLAGGPGEST